MIDRGATMGTVRSRSPYIAKEDAVETAENLRLLLAILKGWDNQAAKRDDNRD
jgi:hypothetical protein